MTTAEDLFWNASNMSLPASLERVEQLRQAAADWLKQEQYLAAGMAFSAVTHAGWGVLDMRISVECVQSAIAAFRRAVEQSPIDSLEAPIAYKKWSEILRYLNYDTAGGWQQLRRDADSIAIAHADRLVHHFGDHPQSASFLVRGYRVRGPVTGPWTPEFPDGEINDSVFNIDALNRICYFRLPSAFRLLVRVGDYQAARGICLRHSGAFTSPGLRGWQFAVVGFTDSSTSAGSFSDAADAFAADTPENARDADGGWTSVNRDLWTPYFRSRHWLARAVREPERIEDCISNAAGCMPPMRSYEHSGVHRYHLFVRSLAGLLGLTHGLSGTEAREEFAKEARFFGASNDDPAVFEFLDQAQSGLDQLRTDRRRGITAVGRAMAALDRIPLLGDKDVEVIRSAMDRHTVGIIDGASRIWIHRTLESIGDERKLRRVLLRLFQNSVPRYAQVRHGPIEYGKDIVVAAADEGKVVLRMYQAKCGDIKKPGWNAIRPQLEEIFQVALDTFQIPLGIDRRVGILVWNGHADPHVEPVMQAWRKDQWAAYNREYEFMHLDDVVTYILDNRLVGALREALSEAGIPIT